MDELKKLQRVTVIRALVLLAAAALVALSLGAVPVVHGILFGGAFTVLKVKLKINNGLRFLGLALQDEAAARRFQVRNSFVLYGITAAVLAVAAFSRHIDIFAAAAALYLGNLLFIVDGIVEGMRAPDAESAEEQA